jgi:beta-galactosidase GanA
MSSIAKDSFCIWQIELAEFSAAIRARTKVITGQRSRNFIRFHRCVLVAVALTCGCFAHAAAPRLEKQGTATQLVVQGKPMLVLGGELGNSSASSAAYMAPHWGRLKRMHLNTIIAPVYWELIEPVEGQFDWKSVDQMLKDARAHDLKLIVLWFGAWKNSMSTYVPSWVKRDQARFPRAQATNGRSVEILSAFSTNTRDADVRAYSELLRHLKAVDSDKNTVVMVQVENEIGMLPVARELGPEANAASRQPVPAELIELLTRRSDTVEPELLALWKDQGAKTGGDWPTVFGDTPAGAEVFTAWHYARFVEAMVSAGKSIYPLPMYVNAALNRTGRLPGEYPSGGPVPHLIDVWKTGAPSLDFIAPDIYFPNFVDLASRYKRADNPFFIPEANNSDKAEVPANAFFAFGKLDAMGFAPFSIESIDEQSSSALAEAYSVLEHLTPSILAAQGRSRMSGFRPRVLEDGTVLNAPMSEVIGEVRFTVTFVDPWTPKDEQETTGHGGLIIQTGPEDFIIAGRGFTVTFAPASGVGALGVDKAWEGAYDARGNWVAGRLLNGDQTHQGRHIRLDPTRFQTQHVKLYSYR